MKYEKGDKVLLIKPCEVGCPTCLKVIRGKEIGIVDNYSDWGNVSVDFPFTTESGTRSDTSVSLTPDHFKKYSKKVTNWRQRIK